MPKSNGTLTKSEAAEARRKARTKELKEREKRWLEDHRNWLARMRGQKYEARAIEPGDVEQVILGVAEGRQADEVCKELGISHRDFHRVVIQDQRLSQAYAEARTLYTMVIIDRTMQEARALDDINPTMQGAMVVVQIAGHKARTAQWLVEKMNPDMFGQRVTTVHEGNPANPVVTKDVSEMSIQEKLEELRRRNRA